MCRKASEIALGEGKGSSTQISERLCSHCFTVHSAWKVLFKVCVGSGGEYFYYKKVKCFKNIFKRKISALAGGSVDRALARSAEVAGLSPRELTPEVAGSNPGQGTFEKQSVAQLSGALGRCFSLSSPLPSSLSKKGRKEKLVLEIQHINSNIQTIDYSV